MLTDVASIEGPCATCSWLRERHDEWRTVAYCGQDFEAITEWRLAELAASVPEYAQPCCPQYVNADKAGLWQPS